MIDVRLVTCRALPAPDPDTPLLASALRAVGAEVDVADWRDPAVDWADACVTLLRSPWDYVDARDEFVAWSRSVAASSRLWNPAPLVEWNTHKSYLLDLDGRGAPIVPTVLLVGGAGASLAGICDARGWNTAVVKPAVGIGAHGAGRFDVGDPAGQRHLDAWLDRGDVLVQPYLASVAREGEWSVVLVDGVVSHAVRKLPDGDEYRVHEQYGGRVEPVTPSTGQVELAERVCAVLPAPTCYARIDLLFLDGSWRVLEVEATEPSLWLDLAGTAGIDRMAAAVLARCE